MHPVRAWLLAAACAAGCSSSETLAPSPTMCQVQACPVAPLSYAAEVIPPAGSTAPTFEFATFDPTSGLFTLAIPATVTLSGDVHIGSGTSTHVVPSTVRASRPSRIAGQPDVVYTAEIRVTDGTYTMQVTPTLDGEVYTLRVISDDPSEQYPPQTFSIPVPADTRFALKLDDNLSLLQVTGAVTDAVQTPLRGLTVQALDLATRASVSTIATTDIVGNYAIQLSSQEAKTVILQVAPPTSELPTLEKRIDLSKPGAGNTLTVNLAMPTGQNAQKFSYPIVGNSSSGAMEPVPFATAAFTADVSDPLAPDVTATVYVVTQSDAGGLATASLIPSRVYQLTVTPLGGSPYQSTTLPAFTVGPTGGTGGQIMLDLRPKVTARVLAPNGKALPNVAVLTGVSSGDKQVNGRAEEIAQLPSDLTDSSGRISLALDAATYAYDFGLVPPPASGAARSWIESVQVHADVALGDLTLPVGTQAFGRVLDANGQTIAGAQVRLYSVAASNAACVMGNLACVSPPREIAEGTTDATGTAAFILPSSAPTLPAHN
ncbi:MAG TPA: hypothetical protein VFF06_09670 [Polyangia bacterium]|nr:hypothetical protein [Polyangia bacterium]